MIFNNLYISYKLWHSLLDRIIFGSKRIRGSRVCLVRGGGIGDLININPVATHLRSLGHQVSILYLGNMNTVLLRQLTGTDSIVVRRTTISKTLIALRSEKFDTIILLPQNNERFLRVCRNYTAISVLNINCKVVVSGTSPVPLKFFRPYIDRKNRDIKEDLFHVNKLFGNGAVCRYRFGFTDLDESIEKNYAIFLLGTNNPANRLKVEHWVKIGETIKVDSILMLGGSSEWEFANAIHNELSIKECVNLCGRTSINESVNLMKSAVHVYSHDTGLMHIADALGMELTVFMSARDIEGRWAPRGDKSNYYRARGLKCGYCLCIDCRHDQKCIDIAVDQFLTKWHKT